MFTNLRLSLIALCVSAAATASAHAGTIGPTNCTSCNGVSYTLTYSPETGNTVDVLLTIDTNGFNANAGHTSYLHAVALKLTSSASNISSVTLVSPPTPTVFTTTVDTGLNNGAGGCGGGSDGFFCSQSSTTTGVAVGSGDVYTFEWKLTLNSLSNLDTTSMDDSVKALYVDASGNKVGAITSEAITLDRTAATPEPSSLMLMGTGVLGLAGALRRRIQ